MMSDTMQTQHRWKLNQIKMPRKFDEYDENVALVVSLAAETGGRRYSASYP